MSDDKQIKKLAKKFNLSIDYIRPKNLSKSTTSLVDTLFHFHQWTENKKIVYDYLVVLQPTSPFRKLKTINQNIYIVLTTNGVPLTKSTFVKLIDSGVDEITISLNADSPEGYQKVMGIDKYETALKNCLNVLRYKKELGLKSPQISIQFLESEHFKNSFYRTIKFWLPYLTGNDKVYFHEIVSEAGTCDIGVQDTGMQNLKTRFPCSEPWQRISVLNDGAVYPCGPVFYWKEKRMPLETSFFCALYISYTLDNHHCVTVRIESVFFFNGLLVCFHHKIMTTECRNHH